ncbi:MAG: DUF1330 domain-containing protein [Gammaproteobacteria bacterium]|nr:DUF1330 domain-containing protein [Gammaproteobacteria bacterium]
MAAYLLADVAPHDMEAYRASGYLEAVVRIAGDYGGRYLARGGEMALLEGDWAPRRMVIIEFPSMADLRAWYDSEAYAPWRALRRELTDSRLVAVDGLENAPA